MFRLNQNGLRGSVDREIILLRNKIVLKHTGNEYPPRRNFLSWDSDFCGGGK